MSSEKPKVLAVVGPTASGKTDLAITLATTYNGEVVSADSRQVYRGLDIGTAKVTEAEMQGVPHYLIDIVNIDTVYTGQDFVRDASQAIETIHNQHKLPIIAGGTFFYLELLRGTMQAAPVPPNYLLREQLEVLDTDTLFQKLTKSSPARAERIDPHNRRRLIRALEITEALGHVPEPAHASESPYDFFIIGLAVDKETLRTRFQARAKTWLTNGFTDEVQSLLAAGVSRGRLREIGFEYTLMLGHIDGAYTEAEFVQKFVEKNWQYAKKQYTWLKRDASIHWIDPQAPIETTALLSAVQAWLQR